MLISQFEDKRNQLAQFVHLLERPSKLADQRILGRFGPVAFGERLAKFDQVASQVELRLRLTSEGVERASLAVGQRAWDVIDDAQSAKRMTVARNERRTGIEADVRLAVHDRVFAEAHILEGIVDDEDPATSDGVRTERHAARRLGNRHADHVP